MNSIHISLLFVADQHLTSARIDPILKALQRLVLYLTKDRQSDARLMIEYVSSAQKMLLIIY